jgi:hypothetical protein
METARGGHEGAPATLVKRHRERLERVIWLRMARRLLGPVDPVDGLQVSYSALHGQFPLHSADPQLPFIPWLRLELGQKPMALHRFHLETQMRDTEEGSGCTGGAAVRCYVRALARLNDGFQGTPGGIEGIRG